jgi:hypothetical protein
VDIFYRIHLKIIKTATNKKVRTIYTELYVLPLPSRVATSATPASSTGGSTRS